MKKLLVFAKTCLQDVFAMNNNMITAGDESTAGVSQTGKGKCAIYARVSTDGQTCDNQMPECEAKARAKGWEVCEVYREVGSAAKHRPVFERMMADARAGKFEAVIVWKVDRFGRSMAKNLTDIGELDRMGVRVASVQEDWLDTQGPCRSLMIAIFSWVAEQERATLIERTKAGLRRAKAAGKILGKVAMKIMPDQAAVLDDWVAEGDDRCGFRELAGRLGVSVATAFKWGSEAIAKGVAP